LHILLLPVIFCLNFTEFETLPKKPYLIMGAECSGGGADIDTFQQKTLKKSFLLLHFITFLCIICKKAIKVF